MCSPQKDLFVVNGQFHLNNVMLLANEKLFCNLYRLFNIKF